MRTSKEGRPVVMVRSLSGWTRAKGWLDRLMGRRKAAAASIESPPVPSAGSQVARLTADELALVRKDLRKVLDQHAESRRVMRYLRALEHGLHKKGRHALEELPVELLRRALGQLDLLVTDRSLPGLATLRSKAAISIADRERLASDRDRNRRMAEHDEVEVEDASHTTFLEVNEEWERSFTGQSGRPPLDEAAPATEGGEPVAAKQVN